MLPWSDAFFNLQNPSDSIRFINEGIPNEQKHSIFNLLYAPFSTLYCMLY